MLLFRSEEALKNWCEVQGARAGAIVALDQVWELSKLWYRERLSVDYHGRTAEQAVEIFRQVGLGSKFWTLVA